MPDPLEHLSARQSEVATHTSGPLIVLGAAGTGKTRALAARHAWLATTGGLLPEHVLAVTHSAAAVDALRTQVEAQIPHGFAELHVHTAPGFAARLLREERADGGLDAFVVTVTAADRLAMLLDRVDELSLRLHDFRGNPAAMLAGVIARIDRMKEAGVTAQEMSAWAQTLPAGDERAAREREFAAIYSAHDGMLRQENALDEGDLVLLATSLLELPHVRERVADRYRQILIDDGQDLPYAHLRLLLMLAADRKSVV